MKPPSLLPPVVNCLWSHIGDLAISLRRSCSLKWLLGTFRAEVDGAEPFPRQLASKVNDGLQIIAKEKDVSKAD